MKKNTTYRYEVRDTVTGQLIALAEQPHTALHNAVTSIGYVQIIDNDGQYRFAARLINGKIQTMSPDFRQALGL